MTEQPDPVDRLPAPLRRRLGLRPLHDAEELERAVPAWLRRTEAENRLPASAAILLAAVLQYRLDERYSLSPQWLLPALEIVLLGVLTVANPMRMTRESRLLRSVGLILVAVITIANGSSAVRLADHLVTGRAGEQAVPLLLSAGAIYLINVIAFGLWYWEIDRGGSQARSAGRNPYGDFLFPQMATPETAPPDWQPLFVDYLYVSFTNATAFSPTDTLPLTRRAKLMMAAQSAVALITVALVVARAVNILR